MGLFDNLLTTDEAAKKCGVSSAVVKKWVESGWLPALRPYDRQRSYAIQLIDLKRFCEKHDIGMEHDQSLADGGTGDTVQKLTDDQRLELARCFALYCGCDPDACEWRSEMVSHGRKHTGWQVVRRTRHAVLPGAMAAIRYSHGKTAYPRGLL